MLFITDGIAKNLIAVAESTRSLGFNAIILDEVHERGRNIDLSIAYLSYFLKKNNDTKTKILLCSATIQKEIMNSF